MTTHTPDLTWGVLFYSEVAIFGAALSGAYGGVNYLDSRIRDLKRQLEAVRHEQALAALKAEYDKHVPLPEYSSPHTLQENAENGTMKPENNWSNEFDQDGTPIYALTKKEANIEAVDFTDQKNRRRYADINYGLAVSEGSALSTYVQGIHKLINNRLRADELSDGDRQFVARMISGLNKFPIYSGTTYRNLGWDNEAEYNVFLREYSVGEEVLLKAFTSTSKRPNGYPIFRPYVVHMVIQERTGVDIADTYGHLRQQEVILLPGTKIKVISVSTANDGHPLIYVQEVTVNDLGRDHGN